MSSRLERGVTKCSPSDFVQTYVIADDDKSTTIFHGASGAAGYQGFPAYFPPPAYNHHSTTITTQRPQHPVIDKPSHLTTYLYLRSLAPPHRWTVSMRFWTPQNGNGPRMPRVRDSPLPTNIIRAAITTSINIIAERYSGFAAMPWLLVTWSSLSSLGRQARWTRWRPLTRKKARLLLWINGEAPSLREQRLPFILFTVQHLKACLKTGCFFGRKPQIIRCLLRDKSRWLHHKKAVECMHRGAGLDQFRMSTPISPFPLTWRSTWWVPQMFVRTRVRGFWNCLDYQIYVYIALSLTIILKYMSGHDRSLYPLYPGRTWPHGNQFIYYLNVAKRYIIESSYYGRPSSRCLPPCCPPNTRKRLDLLMMQL